MLSSSSAANAEHNGTRPEELPEQENDEQRILDKQNTILKQLYDSKTDI